MKTCSKCKKPKRNKLFNKRKRSHDGMTAACKDCLNKYQMDTKSPERKMKADLKRHYKLTLEAFYAMLKEQNYLCALCSTDKPGGRGRWHVDHDHQTNTIRGLLCHKCNVGLGHFNDNVALLEKALNYLKGTYANRPEEVQSPSQHREDC